MITGFWSYNTETNKFESSQSEPFSLFPTIVEPKKKIVYCRQCHRWEYIVHFQNNLLTTQCGKMYKGPFVLENSLVDYSYFIQKKQEVYSVVIKSQIATKINRRNVETNYIIDMGRKILYRDGQAIFENEDLQKGLSREVTDAFLEEMGAAYKARYGMVPTVSSSLRGFNLIIGYMLCPFNVNFFKIAQHWGLNPYDKAFSSLSSGDTPTAENEMFESLHIRPTKQIRKMYQKFPQAVVCYAAVQDLGFTDVNILQRSAGSHVYAFFKHYMISFAGGEVSYPLQFALKTFVTDMLAISSQKTVWNSIERTVAFLTVDSIDESIVTDGINTYVQVHEHLTDREKKEVMREGFNVYTHDFLVRRGNELGEQMDVGNIPGAIREYNEHFDIEQSFLDLEYKAGENYAKQVNPQTKKEEYMKVEDDDRYCFYVARDSFTLKTIGSEMKNCVGWGYQKAVKARRATIVYAKYKGKYRICIEVSPQFTVRQSLGPCNQPLQGKDLEAYSEWCRERRIQFVKAFGIHAAP